MVGWPSASESIGVHSNDGCLYYEYKGGKSIPFGPTSCAGDTIGCGIIFDASGKPKTIFFTRNRSTVGIFPLRSRDYDMVFPVVTSASPAVVTVNLSAMPPAISMECVLNTFVFEVKYNDSSNKFKPVSIKGPKNSKGETPVIFNGYKDTVWVPHYRLRRTETPKQIEFSDLEQAFSSVVDGDTIEVRIVAFICCVIRLTFVRQSLWLRSMLPSVRRFRVVRDSSLTLISSPTHRQKDHR
jgi:hypothetical protein